MAEDVEMAAPVVPRAGLVVALAAFSAAVSGGFARFSYGLLLPAMTDDVLGSYAQAGSLGSITLAAYLAGVIACGLLATRFRLVPVLRVGLSGTAVGFLVMAAAPGYPVLVVGMILIGACSALVWIPASGIASSAVTAQRRGLALGVVTGGAGLGIFVVGQLTGLWRSLVDPSAWREIWLLQAIVTLGVIGLSFAWLRDLPRHPIVRGPIGTGNLRRVPGWRWLASGYATYAMGFTLYMTFLVAALEAEAGYSPARAAGIFSLYGFTSIFGGVALGRLSDRLGRWPTLILIYGTLAAVALLVLMWAQPAVALSSALYGLLLTGTGAVVFSTIGDRLQGPAAASAFAAVTVGLGTAQAAGPWLGGLLVERTGSFAVVFQLAAVCFMVAGATAVLGLRRRHLRAQDPPPATGGGTRDDREAP